MDISVATFPFLVFTVKSLEQFPYTVSYGSRRCDRCIQRGKTCLSALGGAGEGAWKKRQEQRGFGGISPPHQAEHGHGKHPASQRSHRTPGMAVLILSTGAWPLRSPPTLTLCSARSQHCLYCSFMACVPIRLVLWVLRFSPQTPRSLCRRQACVLQPGCELELRMRQGLENGRGTEGN